MFDNNKKRGEYEKWPSVENGEAVTEAKPSYTEESSPIIAEGFFTKMKEGFRKLANMAMNLAIWAVVGTSCWFGKDFIVGAEFSEIRTILANHGHEVEANRLGEIGKVCRNGSGTPMACQMLVLTKESELAMLTGQNVPSP